MKVFHNIESCGRSKAKMFVGVRRVLSAWSWKSRTRCRPPSGFYFDKEMMIGIFEAGCIAYCSNLVHSSNKWFTSHSNPVSGYIFFNGANEDAIMFNLIKYRFVIVLLL